MYKWVPITLFATIVWGVYPIFADKAAKVHGAKMNFVLDSFWVLFPTLIISFIYRDEFKKITVGSFFNSLGIALSTLGFLAILIAWEKYPEQSSVIYALSLFGCVIIHALISGLVTKVSKIETHQWVAIIGASFFIVLAMLSKEDLIKFKNMIFAQ